MAKGAIENANKLIRKYIPKKSNFDDFSDKRIMEIQKKLNRRPREKINFDSPKQRFSQMSVNFCICCWTLQMKNPNRNAQFLCCSSLNKGISLSSEGMPKRRGGRVRPQERTQTKGYVVEVNSNTKKGDRSLPKIK